MFFYYSLRTLKPKKGNKILKPKPSILKKAAPASPLAAVAIYHVLKFDSTTLAALAIYHVLTFYSINNTNKIFFIIH